MTGEIFGSYIIEYNNFYKNNFIQKVVNKMGFDCGKESALFDDKIIKLEFLYFMQNATDKISGIYKGVKFELFETFFY